MKEALKDAGLNSTMTENMRDSAKGRDRNQTEKHQHSRNFCEVCELIMPDVERFKHKNPTVDAEWICVGCADKNNILDEFRLTNQSDFAKQKKYRREFGATKEASEFTEYRPSQKHHNQNKTQNTNSNNNNRNKNKNFSKNRNSQGGRPGENRNSPRRNDRNDNQGRRPNPRRGGNVKTPSAKYIIDENGEKNFNC